MADTKPVPETEDGSPTCPCGIKAKDCLYPACPKG